MSYFKNYKAAIVLLVLTFLVSAGANSLLPYLSGTVYFDDVLGKKSDFTGFGALQRAIFLAACAHVYCLCGGKNS